MKIIDKLYVVMMSRYDYLLHNPTVAYFNRDDAVEFIEDKLKDENFKYIPGGGRTHKDEFWHTFHKRYWIRETNLAAPNDEPYEGDDW